MKSRSLLRLKPNRQEDTASRSDRQVVARLPLKPRPQPFTCFSTELLGDHSEREPPDPISNSEVKPLSADDSVAVCHVKVGNCQALNTQTQGLNPLGFFMPENRVNRLIGEIKC
jgi:hypothetical protein